MLKILILGNYCSSNRGDAAILAGLINLLNENFEDPKITISSFYPEVADKVHNLETVSPVITTEGNFNKKSLVKKLILYLFYAKGFFRNRISSILTDKENRTLQIYSESDLIIAAGGTYLNDNYRPAIFGRLVELYLAKKFRKLVVLCGHSIGPFNQKDYKLLAKIVFNTMDLITLRDGESAHILNDLGVRKPEVQVTGDTAFFTGQISAVAARSIIKREYPNYKTSQQFVSVSVRKWTYYKSGNQIKSHQEYIASMADICDHLIDKYGVIIVFLSTCTDFGGYKIDDRKTAQQVQELMKNKNKSIIIKKELSLEEIKGVYGLMEMHIGTRMHSNIFAISMFTPVVAIAYEFKTFELMKEFKLDEYVVDIDNISSNNMIDVTTKIWQKRNEISKNLPDLVNRYNSRAKESIYLIKNLLESYTK